VNGCRWAHRAARANPQAKYTQNHHSPLLLELLKTILAATQNPNLHNH
jgi:hypothetical protein